MPPKAKFTIEQITEAALEIVKEENFEGLTAKALAKKLGSSACPIFTIFETAEYPGEAAAPEDYIKKSKAVFENEKWLLSEMIY